MLVFIYLINNYLKKNENIYSLFMNYFLFEMLFFI